MNRQLKVALYMRLSKEDEDIMEKGNSAEERHSIGERHSMEERQSMEKECFKEESNSIRTQRILLRSFAEEHFRDSKILEFKDDGYSGVTLERPGVSAMLELVKESVLDCIIVKDFSRFSRDYIELGTYLEQIFPFMGVRFISVNDNYDSEAGSGGAGGMDISFRNLMYDLYSKDLSVKVKSSLAAKKERGQFVGANCPFGYEKAPGDKYSLVVVEDEAEIVRRIFRMTAEGMTSSQIAKAFNKEGVKTPIEFRLEKGKASRRAKGGRFAWQGSTICAILRNESYTGDMVHGKTYKEYLGGRNRVKPRSEWRIFRNHHAPIISRELFEEVQKGRGGGKPRRTGQRHPLSGRLVCGCCGRNLHIRKGLNPYFCCPSLYDNPRDGCIRKANAMFLEELCLYELQNHLEQLSDKSGVREERRRELWQHLEELKRERQRLQLSLQSLKKQKIEIYERYAEKWNKGIPWNKGISWEKDIPGKKSIPEKAGVSELNGEDADKEGGEDSLAVMNGKIAETEARLSEMDGRIDSIEAELARKQGAEELGAYLEIPELTGEAVQRFIRQIVVKDEQDAAISWCD